jgi:hypothetical protein
LRQGRTIQLKAVVQELKDTPDRQASVPSEVRPDRGANTAGTALPIPGMKARNLSPEVARALASPKPVASSSPKLLKILRQLTRASSAAT